MAYLLIPAACFVVLAGLVWLWFDAGTLRWSWKATIDDLDRILSALKTATLASSCLILRVPGQSSWLKLTFPRHSISLQIPLASDLQQVQRDSYLETLRGLKLDPKNWNRSGKQQAIVCWIEGSRDDAATVIKDVFARLYDEDRSKYLEFEVFGRFSKDKAIDQAVDEYHSEITTREPTETARALASETIEQQRAGCMGPLVSLFLLPIPFVMAYLEYGYLAASIVLVAIIVAREIYNRWKKRRSSFLVGDALKVVVLTLAGMTIYANDSLYLQLIPTVALSAAAIGHLYGNWFNLPWLSLLDPAICEGDPTSHKFLSYTLITTCMGAAVLNEYIRAYLPLDTWIWYFAFVRIELILGFILTGVSYGMYFSRDSSSTEPNTE